MILAGSDPETYPRASVPASDCCGLGRHSASRGDRSECKKLSADRAGLHASGHQAGTKEGVDTVHTLGFGFSCTGLGLARIGDIFERMADLQGERLVRVPPPARRLPSSEAILL